MIKVILVDSGSIPCDVSNDVMKSTILEISNDDISVTACPIDFMLDCRAGFSGTADGMDLLPAGSNPRWPPADILHISNNNISGTGRTANFVFSSIVSSERTTSSTGLLDYQSPAASVFVVDKDNVT